MRRGLAGLLFFVAARVPRRWPPAAGGCKHVAFDTATSGDLADVVLRDPDIRNQIATVAADATAATLGAPGRPTCGPRSTSSPRRSAGSRADAPDHRRLPRPPHRRCATSRCRSPGPQLVELTRNQQVAEVPPVTLPVQEVPILSTIRGHAALGRADRRHRRRVALLLGLIAHPRKADAVLGIGVFCIVAARGGDRARLRRAGVPAAGARRHDLGRASSRRSPGTPCPSSPAPRSSCWPSGSR